ncbi:hypothetical protein CcCBS67573_g04004 [Chytriomyces confervae]|uniref:C2H2-type domain-containing protein n=1 Tax=Chytriomyces confervae TaxID=246404 RepID=A0A507FGL3_9FUNG|nr:hypothetical protein CcCBS67573_g04004 [Chytriomyces confervae]
MLVFGACKSTDFHHHLNFHNVRAGMASVLNSTPTRDLSSSRASAAQMLQRLADEVEELRRELRSKSGALFLLKCENEALRLDHADLQKDSARCVCRAQVSDGSPVSGTDNNSDHTTDTTDKDSHRSLLAAAVDHLEIASHPDLSDLTDPDTPEDTANDDPDSNHEPHSYSDSFSYSSRCSSASATISHASHRQHILDFANDSCIPLTKKEPDSGVGVLQKLEHVDIHPRETDDGYSSEKTTHSVPACIQRDINTDTKSNTPLNSTLIIRKYICTYCSKRFTRPSTLQTHMNSHTGHRPFQCVHCDMRFTVSSNMKRHMGHCHSK